MDVSAVRESLDQVCDFPVDHGVVIDRIGNVELDAPTAGSETVATALSRTEQTTYRSAKDIVTTLKGTVGAAYVGCRYYDDRSGARATPADRRARSL